MIAKVKLSKRIILSCVLTTILVLSTVAIASAHPLSHNWQGDYVGYCGVTSGGYVLAVQYNLAVHNINLGSSGVDGYFGSYTYNGVKTYQGMHGLSKDGCVGPNTWYNMSTHLVYRYTSYNYDYYYFYAPDYGKAVEYVWDRCWWHVPGGYQVNHGWSLNWCL